MSEASEKSPQSLDFAGLRVVALESRRGEEMARQIERLGGCAAVSPSMREVPLEDVRPLVDFANHLITGQVDVVVLMTGGGVRRLVTAIERHVDRDKFLGALSDIVTIARGPKPVAALKELGVEPTYRVEEPATWRQILRTVDEHVTVANHTVALQESGQPSASLIAGLEARGARVVPLKVYRWDLPEDTAALEANARTIAEGEADVVLFTAGPQVTNLLQVADELGRKDEVRAALGEAVVGSIGPVTSEALRQHELAVDLEADHPRMGSLVETAARLARGLLERKRRVVEVFAAPSAADMSDPAYDSLFLRTCRREPTERTPIWLMRQAGRYMAEYRKIREKTTFLELCKNPDLCAEVMITTVERLGVDAAIIFSDLLPILEPMGFELEFAPGEGPIIHNPVRETDDLNRVVELETVESLDFVMETVKRTRAGLHAGMPVIGFGGAPFTLASYTIEGGASRNFLHTKTLMYRDEGLWHGLMQRLARAVTRYLNAQIAAGAHAVQLFDSWVGCLGPEDYRRYVLPYTRMVIAGVTPGVPVINFATGNPALLPLLSEAGGAVIGVDWRIRLDDAWEDVGPDKAVQGNLEPLALLAPRERLLERAREVLEQAAGRPGHIFNLGHGVVPQTPVDNVLALVDYVHEASERRI